MKQIKTYIIAFTLLFLMVSASQAQQTNSRNYIISRSYKQAGANPNDVSKVVTQVEYIDGLGRSLQNVVVGQSPAGTDIVTPMAYDPDGRQPKQYLPYAATGNGSYKSTGIVDVGTWYLANSAGLQTASPTTLDLARPYQETVFETSPLNRPSTTQGAGTRSRSSSITYNVNVAGEVKRYDYNPTTNTISTPGDYAAGTLNRKAFKDAQDFESNEYTDLLGQLVCKSVLTGTQTLYTFYVYDDMGLLRGVLQPNFQDDASFTNSAFLYDYDEKKRMVRKQVPGAGATETVYDQYDRPVYSRDANQLARGMWGFTKYDIFNRPVVTGEITSSATRETLAGNVNTGTQHHESRSNSTTEGYSLNLTAPTTATDANLLTITFYDDYAFTKPSGFNYAAEAGYPASANTAVKSLVTGGRTRMLPGDGSTGGWLTNVVYYDGEYRTIQTVRELHDLGAGANERVSTLYKYDLAPVVAQQKTVQVVSGVTHSHISENTYDHADRLLSIKETVSSGAKTKTAYTLAQQYNTLGQLKNKWFHGYANNDLKYRRRTDYTNNIQGWLTDAKTWYQHYIGTDLAFYGFNLAYKNVLNEQQYSNGNITSLEWRIKDQTAFSGGLTFTYDNANRLLSAVKPSAASYSYVDTENGISYDKNGNIKTLVRAGVSVDNLTYSYSGNRLSNVDDVSGNNTGVKNGSSGYSYDPNGNMLNDGNRGSVLTYNFLNLPKTVAVGGKTLVYDYDAGGNKHKYVADTLTAKYAGRFEYRQVGSANNLVRISTSEGQLVPSGDTLRFDYFLKDHLGNVRVVWDESGKVIQQTGYYAFGLSIDRNDPAVSEAARNSVNRKVYNGKELQIGTSYIDYGARMYLPEIGRWGAVDPMAQIYEGSTPYNYVFNNPVIWTDPDGRCPTCPGGDDVYGKGAIVENQYGSWVYQGKGEWETVWQAPPTNSNGQALASGAVSPVQIEFAILAPASLPLKTGSRIINFGLELANPVGGLGLAQGGRGAISAFLKVAPTVAIRTLSFAKVRITTKGVDRVIEHLARFGPDAANAKMIDRLKSISNGSISATDYDLKFYTHELREFVRYRAGGLNDVDSYDFYSSQHAATLMDYGIPYDQAAKFQLYHPDAVKAAGADF